MINRILIFYRRRFWKPEKYARYIGVKIGNKCHISTTYFGSEPYLITIGNHVQITNNVKFFTHSGGWIFREEFPNIDSFGKIEIKDNVYIGNNVLILPGVTVGSNVMIGAGSVVTKSIPDNTVVAGNPAKIIGNVTDVKQKMLDLNLETKGMSKDQKRNYLLSLSEDKFIKK